VKHGGMCMKEVKFFRKQAEAAERRARSICDREIAQTFFNMAEGFRCQANALKADAKTKRKAEKKQR
jgi:hypothetical protein